MIKNPVNKHESIANGFIRAIKRNETAQFIKEAAERRREANRRTANRRRATERAAAKTHEARVITARVETDRNTPNTADKVRYLIRQETEREEDSRSKGGAGNQAITTLKGLDFLTLYYSNRLLLFNQNPREAAGAEKLQENEIIGHLKHLNPVVLLTDNGSHRAKVSDLKRVGIRTEEANTPQALKYLLSFKTEGRRAENTQTNEFRAIKPLISYNNIGYEPNNIIIIGKEAAVRGVLRKFQRLNKTQNSYYNFIEEESHREQRAAVKESGEVIYRRTARRRTGAAGRRYRESRAKALDKAESTAEREDIKRSMLYNVLYVVDTEKTTYKAQTQKQGLNNIRQNEREVLRREPRSHKETEAEAAALLEIAKGTDGRQTTANIEFDIRRETKYLLSYGANELYYIISEVENQERGSRKETALLNVLKGYKESREIEEYIKEDIESQQQGADSRSEFKAQKKSKSRYNTKHGILSRNKNPQRLRDESNKNRAILKEIRAKQEEERKARNRAEEPSETLREFITAQRNITAILRADIERRNRRTANRIRREEAEVIKSIYGDLIKNRREAREMINDHRKDFEFITADKL